MTGTEWEGCVSRGETRSDSRFKPWGWLRAARSTEWHARQPRGHRLAQGSLCVGIPLADEGKAGTEVGAQNVGSLHQEEGGALLRGRTRKKGQRGVESESSVLTL